MNLIQVIELVKWQRWNLNSIFTVSKPEYLLPQNLDPHKVRDKGSKDIRRLSEAKVKNRSNASAS